MRRCSLYLVVFVLVFPFLLVGQDPAAPAAEEFSEAYQSAQKIQQEIQKEVAKPARNYPLLGRLFQSLSPYTEELSRSRETAGELLRSEFLEAVLLLELAKELPSYATPFALKLFQLERIVPQYGSAASQELLRVLQHNYRYLIQNDIPDTASVEIVQLIEQTTNGTLANRLAGKLMFDLFQELLLQNRIPETKALLDEFGKKIPRPPGTDEITWAGQIGVVGQTRADIWPKDLPTLEDTVLTGGFNLVRLLTLYTPNSRHKLEVSGQFAMAHTDTFRNLGVVVDGDKTSFANRMLGLFSKNGKQVPIFVLIDKDDRIRSVAPDFPEYALRKLLQEQSEGDETIPGVGTTFIRVPDAANQDPQK